MVWVIVVSYWWYGLVEIDTTAAAGAPNIILL